MWCPSLSFGVDSLNTERILAIWIHSDASAR
jgi:hypothetical protein